MKPRVRYEEVFVAPWDAAFAKVKALGEGAKLGPWTIAWISDDPQWVQLSQPRQKLMVRRGDSLLVELTK